MKKIIQTIGIATLTPYLVLSQGAFPIVAESSDINQRSRMFVAEAKSAETSYAASGVKLLHEIFQKLRNSNQLALNNPTKQLAAASQAFKGSLDPLLAIRPAEKSSNKTQSLAYAPMDKKVYVPRGFANYGTNLGQTLSGTTNQRAGAASLNGATNGTLSGATNGTIAGATNGRITGATNGTLAGATNGSLAGATNGSLAGATNGSLSGATNGTIGGAAGNSITNWGPASNYGGSRNDESVQDKVSSMQNMPTARAKTKVASTARRSTALDQEAPSSTPAGSNSGGLSPQNSQMLAKSVSRLMQSTRQLSTLSQANESSVRNFGSAKSDIRDERTISTQAGGPVIQEYGSERGSKDFLVTNAARSAENMDQYSNGAPLMSPDQPGQFKYLRNQLMALLPPSVVGGIPMARLGATEQELSPTLTKKNGAAKQIIDDWTVWTVKSANGHSAAVQLYMRHKVVEAIRVFQPEYVGEEVGIKIGDELSTIKVKFGEPAFILSEPEIVGHGSPSQNYVYPISHVAFQLARSKAHPSPQVVSVLIFDVQ